MTTKEMTITAKEVGELRNRTGAGMMDCKAALQEAKGDMDAAIEILRKKGIMKAEKRGGREAREGLITSYIHFNGKIGVLVEINCETDFVARTDDFKGLVKSVAEHIAATAPLAVDKDQISAEIIDRERRIYVDEVKIEAFYRQNCLLSQPWVRDDKKTVGDLVKEMSGKTGENIQVRRFTRYQMGE
jgi:elongation factor Ts